MAQGQDRKGQDELGMPHNQRWQQQRPHEHQHQQQSSADPVHIVTPQKSECSLWSLVQYECDLSPERIVCKPVFRLLKRCKGRPTIEVTPLYDPLGNILLS
ncbi:unnamed protein product [Mortierella alpina]